MNWFRRRQPPTPVEYGMQVSLVLNGRAAHAERAARGAEEAVARYLKDVAHWQVDYQEAIDPSGTVFGLRALATGSDVVVVQVRRVDQKAMTEDHRATLWAAIQCAANGATGRGVHATTTNMTAMRVH